MRSSSTVVFALAAALAVSCQGDDGAPVAGNGDSSSGGGTTGTMLASTGPEPADSTGADGDSDSGGLDGEDGEMGECSIWEQDCAEGDKCVPWSEMADLIPDDIRCCPAVENGGLHGEACTVEGYFGSCIDDCAPGHLCLDIDGDGAGVCQKFCTGEASNPICELDESCLIYFAGVPFCFPQCDPLVQDCIDSEGCYPDADAAGGTGFICLPTIGGGKLGDVCWLLSTCEPGLLCVSPDFLPDCPDFAGCCSSICDTSEPDVCDSLVEGTECVSWYFAGQTPPSADLQNVGACAIP